MRNQVNLNVLSKAILERCVMRALLVEIFDPLQDHRIEVRPDQDSAPPRAVILLILRRTRFCGQWLGFVSDRRVPAAANSKKPEPKAENRPGNRHRGRREAQRGADHDEFYAPDKRASAR
jgi:hypothetical protein